MSNFNNKTYFKMGIGFDDPFTRVPNIILDEKNISAKALGVYVKIIRFQNATDHKIYISSLANELKEGKDAIRSAIHGLIELGYIEREALRNEKGHMNGYVYTVHAQPIVKSIVTPSSENPTSDNPVSDNTTLKKKINKKENNKKENKVVVVADEKENHLLDLYKTFKLEKRVMPHTIKLLKEYTNKFDIDVFEQVFINASEEDVKKKYAYIKATLEELDKKNIRNIKDYEQDKETYKAKLEAKKTTKTASGTKGSNQVKTNKAHNVNNTFKKYEEKELEKLLKENQETKFVKVEEAAANENKESEFDIFGHFIKSKSSEEYFNALPEDIKNKVISLVDFDNKAVFIPNWIISYANRI